MTRDDQLEKFLTKYAKPKNFETILKLDAYCKENKLELANKTKKSFCELFEKVQSLQNDEDKKEISVITLGVSRTFTILKQYKAILTAYSEDFYFEKDPIEVELDLSEYFSFYESLEKELSQDIKKYIGLVNKSDVQKFMQSTFTNYVRYITNICRVVLRDIEEVLFKEVIQANDLKIYSGEHKNDIELIYAKSIFDEEVQKNALELVQNRREVYTYESFCSVELQDKDLRNSKFEYCFFNNSNFDSSDFYLSFFIGTSFRNCSMKFADFGCALLIDVDFGNANLHSATFEKSSAAITKPIEDRLYSPGFLGANFKGADLREVTFAESDFTSANFENAKFSNTDFTNTILKDAVFTKESLNELNLSEKQLGEIITI